MEGCSEIYTQLCPFWDGEDGAFDLNTIPEAEIFRWIERNYDLRPAGIIKKLGVRAPVFAKTAAYGHFGRDDAEFSWEKCDPKALAELKAMVDEAKLK